MTTTSTTTNAHAGTIIFGVDGSESADHALAWAVDEAVAERRALALVHSRGSGGLATGYSPPAGQ